MQCYALYVFYSFNRIESYIHEERRGERARNIHTYVYIYRMIVKDYTCNWWFPSGYSMHEYAVVIVFIVEPEVQMLDANSCTSCEVHLMLFVISNCVWTNRHIASKKRGGGMREKVLFYNNKIIELVLLWSLFLLFWFYCQKHYFDWYRQFHAGFFSVQMMMMIIFTIKLKP